MHIEPERSSAPLILHVDDEEEILKLVSLILTRGGFRVASIVDSQAAVATADDLRPDLILMDILHSDLSGLEVLADLKSDGRVDDIPVVMLTAVATANSREEAMELGAADYLVKPCLPNDLIEKIATTLDANGQERAF